MELGRERKRRKSWVDREREGERGKRREGERVRKSE
jgi:hypothetical protein